MPLIDRLTDLFQKSGRIQLTDRQLASIPHVRAAGQPAVNTVCKRLFKEGKLVRRKVGPNITNMSPNTWRSIVPNAPPLVFPEVSPLDRWWDNLHEAILSYIYAGGHFRLIVFRGNGNVVPSKKFRNWTAIMGIPIDIMSPQDFDAKYGYNPLPIAGFDAFVGPDNDTP